MLCFSQMPRGFIRAPKQPRGALGSTRACLGSLLDAHAGMNVPPGPCPGQGGVSVGHQRKGPGAAAHPDPDRTPDWSGMGMVFRTARAKNSHRRLPFRMWAEFSAVLKTPSKRGQAAGVCDWAQGRCACISTCPCAQRFSVALTVAIPLLLYNQAHVLAGICMEFKQHQIHFAASPSPSAWLNKTSSQMIAHASRV